MTHSGLCRRESDSRQSGTALVSSLALLAILMILFLAAMTYCLRRYGQHVKAKNRIVAEFLADAGIQRAISQMRDTSLFVTVPKEGTPNRGTLQAITCSWGPYLLVRSEGIYGNQSVQASAVVGSRPPDYFDAAITVCDANYPFVVAGNTTINGDVNTGPLGMTTGRIRGEGIINENYHTGALHATEGLRSLRLDSTVLSGYAQDVKQRRLSAVKSYAGTQVWSAIDSAVGNDDFTMKIENNLRLENCRYTSPSRITSICVNGYAELAGSTRISGLVEIIASGPITVSDSTVVDEAILYSEDSIVITGLAQFSGIAISKRRIVMKGKAAMSYPCLLLLSAESSNCSDSCGIWVTSKGSLEGTCYLHLSRPKEQDRDYQVFLDTNTTFTGAIVSEGKVDVRGTVNGTIVTSQFLYVEPTTTYVNWAKDLHVNRSQLNFEPVPPLLTLSRTGVGFRIVREDVNK